MVHLGTDVVEVAGPFGLTADRTLLLIISSEALRVKFSEMPAPCKKNLPCCGLGTQHLPISNTYSTKLCLLKLEILIKVIFPELVSF